MKTLLLTAVFSILLFSLKAQIGIGTTTPDANAVLDLNGGTNKGLLLPRLSNSQITALSTAANGMLVFNTTDNFLYIRKSNTWQKVTDNSNGFSLPYVGSVSSIGNAVFLTNNTGNALSAQSLGTGTGVYGYSANGNGIMGETNAGTAGYFNALGSGIGLVVDNGYTGLGTTAPGAQLHVVSASDDAVRIQSPNNPYLSFYSGAAYKGFLWFNGAEMRLGSASGTGHAVSIAPENSPTATFLPNGSVGIGVTNPTLGLLQTRGSVGAVAALLGDNTTGVAIENNYPGIAFNSYYNAGRKAIDNGYGSLVGLDPTTGRFYIATSPAANTSGQGNTMPLDDRLVINADGSIGVQGNTNPTAPLSFADFVGNKISFFGDASSPHYGMGIQGGLMQLYTNGTNADIAFGYGTSGAFTEKYRMGNSGYFNINNGRMRFTGDFQSGYSSGIEFTNSAGSVLKGFVGMKDDNTFGLYGFAGAGWGFEYNVINGNVGVGTTSGTAKMSLSNSGGTALEINGGIKVSGTKPVFVLTCSLSNLTDNYNPPVNFVPGNNFHAVYIDNALSNNDPNAIILVTPVNRPLPLAVTYDATVGKWKINIEPAGSTETTCYGLISPKGGSCGASYQAAMPFKPNTLFVGDKFNVMIVNQ